MVINTNIFFLFLAFLVSPITVVVSAWKWYILLKVHKTTVSFLRLLSLYYVGYMFNNIMPSNIGGDIVISYELAKYTKSNSESVASIFMNRFTGLIVLIFAAIVSLTFNVSLFLDLGIILTLSVAALGSTLFIWVILDRRIFVYLHDISGKIKIASKFIGKLIKLQDVLLIYTQNIWVLVHSLLISILFFILMVINIYLSCLAFGSTPSILGLTVITPFVQVISMLPISLGGAGLKEWAYIIAFPEIGMSASVGLSVSLLLRLKAIFSGLIGGLVYLLMSKNGIKDYVPIQQTREID